jgi:hypothetical protein
VQQRGQREQRARGEAGDDPLELAAGIQRAAEHERERRGGERQPVGDDLVVEVDERDRHEERHQHDPEDEARRVTGVHERDRPEEDGGHHLDGRIALGDRRRAAATAPAEQQPREDRDVVVRLDRRVAGAAVRARRDERLAPRQAVGDDVQK